MVAVIYNTFDVNAGSRAGPTENIVSLDTTSHLYVTHSHCMQHTGNPPCSPCLMCTAWHRESLKSKEKFGTREGFEICPNQSPPLPRYC